MLLVIAIYICRGCRDESIKCSNHSLVHCAGMVGCINEVVVYVSLSMLYSILLSFFIACVCLCFRLCCVYLYVCVCVLVVHGNLSEWLGNGSKVVVCMLAFMSK